MGISSLSLADTQRGPVPLPPSAADTQRGSQATPLTRYVGEGGTTGNKTTNKDLPEWLRKLGMKGDAYAGGMLKPELRYGFMYKNGKIHFADGTSYAAKKNKGGTYSYTDSSGKAVNYSPTDEQNAYNQAYKKSTSNQSFWDKAKNTVKFELDHGVQMLKQFGKDPERAFLGAADPFSSKLWGKILGKDYEPIVDQMGGATPGRYADYERRTGNALGYAKPMQDVAHAIAASYAGNAVGVPGDLISGAAGLADAKFGAGAVPLPALDGREGEVSDTTHGARAPTGPLRRFERTQDTVLTNMRGDPNMKSSVPRVVKTVGVAAPTSIPGVAAGVKTAFQPYQSSPKTPPAQTIARQQGAGLADVRRTLPRRPSGKYAVA